MYIKPSALRTLKIIAIILFIINLGVFFFLKNNIQLGVFFATGSMLFVTLVSLFTLKELSLDTSRVNYFKFFKKGAKITIIFSTIFAIAIILHGCEGLECGSVFMAIDFIVGGLALTLVIMAGIYIREKLLPTKIGRLILSITGLFLIITIATLIIIMSNLYIYPRF